MGVDTENSSSSSASHNNTNVFRLNKRLSRSLSFALQDEILVDFESEEKIPPAKKQDTSSYIVLGEFNCTYNRNIRNDHFSFYNTYSNCRDDVFFRNVISENDFDGIKAVVKDRNPDYEKTLRRMRKSEIGTHYYLGAEGDFYFEFQHSFRHKLPLIINKYGAETKCDLRLFGTPNGIDEIYLRLEVRWPSGDPKTLETEEAFEDTFVQMYWANGRSFVYRDHNLVVSNLEDGTETDLSNLKIPNTFDIIPCPQLEAPFLLSLYDYQLRTLAWMQGIEDGEASLFYSPNIIELGDERFVDLITKKFGLKKDMEDPKKNIRSGIIADKPGVGKTITTVALFHTRPFDIEDYLFQLVNGRIRSRATAIFAPNNICDQWELEIRKCLGYDIKVLQIKGKAQYQELELLDILTCDIVIVSYNFLSNQIYLGSKVRARYLENFGKNFEMNTKKGLEGFVNSRKKGTFAFTWIHFHRVVCDEFHEITDKSTGIRDQLYLMTGDTIWGLTGTPRLENTQTVCKFADYLNLDASETWENPDSEAFRFVRNRVRRNEPEIQFPAPIFENIRVKQTPVEYTFYRSCVATSDIFNLLMLCNHYQIGQVSAGVVDGFGTLTIEQVTDRVQAGRIGTIEDLEKKILQAEEAEEEIIEKQQEAEEALRKAMSAKKVDNKKVDNKKVDSLRTRFEAAQRRVVENRRIVETLKVELRPIKAQFNFFQNFVDSYLTRKGDINCSVCLEDEIKDELGILPCGHVFCWSCASDVVKIQKKCPICRGVVADGQIMKTNAPPVEEILPEEPVNDDSSQKLNPNKFGSKIRELVSYLQRTMDESESHRFIVFIQFSDLADLVSKALNTYGIETARLKRGWADREKALKKFRAGLTIPEHDKTNVGASAVNDINEKSENEVAEPKNEEVDVHPKLDKGKRRADSDLEQPTKKIPKFDKPVKVLMLSARDSVSGLNLTEASHCIILHPFYSNIEDYAIASEKQGVARVLRNGQKKVVKIVRFVVDNTVEQEIHDRRLLESGGVEAMSVDH
ncbi:DNA helicase rad5 [Nowakowskiella sp. JEL0078]|nr:DNA helicase rad5 [Nowakowskiella sp. JEL0078]